MDLLRLVDQSVWANLQWVEFVYSQPDPEARPRELLAHTMVSERVWFDRINGTPNTTTGFSLLSQAELVRGFQENAATFRRLIDSQLEEVVDFRRAHGYHHSHQFLDREEALACAISARAPSPDFICARNSS